MRFAKLRTSARYADNAVFMRHITASACAVVAGSGILMMPSAYSRSALSAVWRPHLIGCAFAAIAAHLIPRCADAEPCRLGFCREWHQKSSSDDSDLASIVTSVVFWTIHMNTAGANVAIAFISKLLAAEPLLLQTMSLRPAFRVRNVVRSHIRIVYAAALHVDSFMTLLEAAVVVLYDYALQYLAASCPN